MKKFASVLFVAVAVVAMSCAGNATQTAPEEVDVVEVAVVDSTACACPDSCACEGACACEKPAAEAAQ